MLLNGIRATVLVDSDGNELALLDVGALTTDDLDTGAGTDTRAVVGLVLAESGGGVLAGSENPVPVRGSDALAELSFKTSGGDVAIPSTPTAYAQGQVIGTEFTLPGMARENGAFLTVVSAVLREILGAAAYNGAAITADATANTIGLTAHTLVNGNKIKFGGTAAPAPLVKGTTYYVVNKATDAFQVSASYGGSAIDLTGTGTAPTITEVPMALPVLLYLSPVAFTAIADAAAYAPAAAEAESLLYPILFDSSSWRVAGLFAIAQDSGPTRMVKAAVADDALYGLLVFNDATGGTLSKQAYLKLSVYAVRD